MIIFKVLDYFIIILFFSITLFNGICVYKKDAQDFFYQVKRTYGYCFLALYLLYFF